MALIDRYRRLGIELTLGPEGRIGVSPPERVTPELKAELLRDKPAILRELSEPRGWWVVTSTGGRIELVEPAPEPGEVLGEFEARTIEVPHQEDPGQVDVWTVCEGDGCLRWWFTGRRERKTGKDRGQ